MHIALYLNGVYESVLKKILQAQSQNPGLVCFLQPYSKGKMSFGGKLLPTETSPMDVYISVTNRLSHVAYSAKIVHWEDKREIEADRLEFIQSHIKNYELETYFSPQEEKGGVNLLSIIDIQPLDPPIHVSCFIKNKNGEPLKERSKAGNWSYVRRLNLMEFGKSQFILEKELQDQVEISLSSTIKNLEDRLQKAQKIPEVIYTTSRSFKRNPDVIAYVLKRAFGKCENCKKDAPFVRKRDKTPFLEVHHVKMLAEGGEDTVDNAVALCPNCHRQMHFGERLH